MFVYVLALVDYWLVCIKSDFHMFVHLTRDAQIEVKILYLPSHC